MTVSFSQMFSLLLPPFNIKWRTHDIFRQQHFRQHSLKSPTFYKVSCKPYTFLCKIDCFSISCLFVCLFYKNICNIEIPSRGANTTFSGSSISDSIQSSLPGFTKSASNLAHSCAKLIALSLKVNNIDNN